jgi:hypothetical protein
MLPTSWQHLRSVPYKRDPLRQVSTSHDKSPSRTQVSSSHDKYPPLTTSLRPARAPPNSDWGVGHDTRHEPGARMPLLWRMGERFPAPCKYTSWRPMQAAGPEKSLNAGLPGCTAVPSTSSPTLPHASFALGTQAPPTTDSGLSLGLSVAG